MLSSAECYITLQMDAVDSSGLVVPVSVWSYKLNDMSTTVTTHGGQTSAAAAASHCRRRLLALEPVNSITARVVFDSHVSFTGAINRSIALFEIKIYYLML